MKNEFAARTPCYIRTILPTTTSAGGTPHNWTPALHREMKRQITATAASCRSMNSEYDEVDADELRERSRGW